jgi:putative methionine-R-sulfoxide reductase with GAF domain
VDDLEAAYVLRCDTVDEARKVIADDPYFAHEVVVPVVVEWQLVGINPAAIDAGSIVEPGDV